MLAARSTRTPRNFPGCAGLRRPSTTVLPLRSVSTLLIVLSGAAAAHAQVGPGFDPRGAERRFEAPQSDNPAPRLPGAPATRSAVATGKPLFVLRGVTVQGARAIPPESLAAAYRTSLGKRVSQADLVTIANAISDTYRAAGFHLSRAIVPPQDIAGGRVRLRVIEGHIAELVVKGDSAGAFGIAAALQPALAERPSRLATLQRQLLLLNDRPGLRITDTQIEEIGTASGRFRLIVTVQTWRLYLSSGIDNLGSRAVGPWQSYSTAALNSIAVPGDSFALNLSTVPTHPEELAFGRVAYEAPVGVDGIRLGGSAYHSDVRPGDERRQFDTRTRTDSAEVHGSFSAWKTPISSLGFTVALAATDATSRDVFGTIYADRVRTLGLSVDYKLQDDLRGTNYFTASFRQGLNMLGASQDGDDLLSHDGASGTFSVVNVWYTRLQTINDAWSIKLASAGQFASAPMLLSQQFYLGGAAFGRGYGSAEVGADNGIAGSFELRFDQALNFNFLTRYQLYGFADSGAVWNHGFGMSDGAALTSVGAGVRFYLRDQIEAGIAVARPLTYAAPDNPNRDWRVLFSLTNTFKLCPGQAWGVCS
jgi:hemolysin activation/secretion protein